MADLALFKTIERKKIYEEVVEQITHLILESHLQQGDQLPSESQLAERFQVSRTVVREAVKVLEQRGLVAVKQGVGTFVCALNGEVVSETLTRFLRANVHRYLQLMDLREMLDVGVAVRLANRIEPADLQALRDRLAKLNQVLDSPEEYAQEDVAFHMDLYRATRNQILLIIMQPVIELLVEAMRASFEMPGSTGNSQRRHVELIDCIANGDPEGARQVTAEIIQRGKQRLHTALEPDNSMAATGV